MGLSRCHSNERQQRLSLIFHGTSEGKIQYSVVRGSYKNIVKIVAGEINYFRSENLINKVSRVRPGVPFTVLGTQFRLTRFVFRLFLR